MQKACSSASCHYHTACRPAGGGVPRPVSVSRHQRRNNQKLPRPVRLTPRERARRISVSTDGLSSIVRSAHVDGVTKD